MMLSKLIATLPTYHNIWQIQLLLCARDEGIVVIYPPPQKPIAIHRFVHMDVKIIPLSVK